MPNGKPTITVPCRLAAASNRCGLPKASRPSSASVGRYPPAPAGVVSVVRQVMRRRRKVRSGCVGPHDPDVVHLTRLEGDVLRLAADGLVAARRRAAPDHRVAARAERNAKVTRRADVLF